MDYTNVPQSIFTEKEENLRRLAELFPAVIKDKQVDFAALREELGQFEEVTAEKYELTWSGKQAAKRLAQSDVAGRTLKYVPEDSKNADTTQNLYIEGDNLEVLKLLRQNYYGAVKMIYIDPPYNTGNDFVYRDNYTMSRAESDEAEGETVGGERMVVNQKSLNRFHANWLNNMYPRLRVAKDLLRDDGVIFISIADNNENSEAHNLRKICDEVFLEDNFLCQIIWDLGTGTSAGHFTRSHEYILVFCKNKMMLPNFDAVSDDNIVHGALKKISRANPASEITFPIGFPFEGDNAVFTGVLGGSEQEFILSDKMEFKNGKLVAPTTIRAGWGMANQVRDFIAGKETYDTKGQKVVRFWFNKQGILFYEKERGTYNPKSVFSDIANTKNGSSELEALFDGAKLFDFPKPVELLRNLILLATKKDDIIIDFFSGSATTAHAVMQLNAEDRCKRQFIMVQYPEQCDATTDAGKNAIEFLSSIGKPTNICEIGKERIRRAGEKIKAEIETENAQLKLGEEPKQIPDIGLQVFRVADTNIRWTQEALKGGQMTLDEAALSDKEKLDFMPDFTDIDVVYEILLRQRDIPLSAKVEKIGIGGRTYMFAHAYVVCLDDKVTKEMVEALAVIEPTPIKYVFRDSAFDDDISFKDETIRRLEAYIARNNGENKKAYTVEFI